MSPRGSGVSGEGLEAARAGAGAKAGALAAPPAPLTAVNCQSAWRCLRRSATGAAVKPLRRNGSESDWLRTPTMALPSGSRPTGDRARPGRGRACASGAWAREAVVGQQVFQPRGELPHAAGRAAPVRLDRRAVLLADEEQLFLVVALALVGPAHADLRAERGQHGQQHQHAEQHHAALHEASDAAASGGGGAARAAPGRGPPGRPGRARRRPCPWRPRAAPPPASRPRRCAG